MLRDGIEVEDLHPKESMKIQQAINLAQDINSDARSEVDPKKADKYFNDLSTGINQDEMNMFFDNTAFGENGGKVDRITTYDKCSEMDSMEFIHRGLELIADDSSQPNDDGDTVKIYSDDEAIKDVINDLFITKLDLNNELWSIIYETIKLGDNFYEVIVDDYKKPKEIRRVRYIDPRKLERIEINGKLSHFKYINKRKTNVSPEQSQKLFPWQILHFKIENKETAPYGGSLLKSGMRTYDRLLMLEDVLLTYKISRAPERRVFYIDVGNLNPVEAKRFMTKMRNSYRTQSFIDEQGNINKKANALSITSDIFVPTREGSSGTRIETLQGGTAMGGGSEDPLLKHFKDKILKTMNIPPQYMGETSDKSHSLSQLDTKFGRFIERIQAQIIQTLNKLAALELFFKGYKKEDLHNFKIELTPPSNVKEITEIDIFNQRMTLIQTIQQLQMFPNEWIMKKILRFSDKEISDIDMQMKLSTDEAQAGGMGAQAPGGAPVGDLPQEGEIPAETPPDGNQEPEELSASVMTNVFGQDMLLENKDDFFKIVRAAEEFNKPEKNSVLLESMAKLFDTPLTPPKKESRNNVISQISINEFKGLDFKNRNIKLYEKTKRRKKQAGTLMLEEVSYNERIISCGNDIINKALD